MILRQLRWIIHLVSKRIELFTFLLGLMLFSVGLSLAWLPAGLIGGGLVLMAISIFGSRKS